jgi:hypothetical protein
MTLTRIQKIGIVVFIVSLAPAYWIADWRHDSKLASLRETLDKEQSLHMSTDKLLVNCEKIATTSAGAYDATHQVCAQGSQIHEHTEQAMALLTQEKANNETKWYRNFALTVLLFNLLAFFLYRASVFFKREAN